MTIASFDVPMTKIICISILNPNVNRSVTKNFPAEIGKKLIPVGCNLHVAINAFKVFFILVMFIFFSTILWQLLRI